MDCLRNESTVCFGSCHHSPSGNDAGILGVNSIVPHAVRQKEEISFVGHRVWAFEDRHIEFMKKRPVASRDFLGIRKVADVARISKVWYREDASFSRCEPRQGRQIILDVLENFGAYDDLMPHLGVQLSFPSVADEETPAWGVLSSHCDRCRTEIKADILLDALLQQHRGELARAATNLQYPANTRRPKPIRNHGPEKIIKRTVIRLSIRLVLSVKLIVPIRRSFRQFRGRSFRIKAELVS